MRTRLEVLGFAVADETRARRSRRATSPARGDPGRATRSRGWAPGRRRLRRRADGALRPGANDARRRCVAGLRLLDDRAAVLNDRFIRGLMTQALKVAGTNLETGIGHVVLKKIID